MYQKKIHIQSPSEFMDNFESDFKKDMKENIREILQKIDYASRGRSNKISPEVFNTPNEIVRGVDNEIVERISPEEAKGLAINFIRSVNEIQLKHDYYGTLKANIRDLVLKEQIINPGKNIDTLVACDTHDMENFMEGSFKITVTIDGEKHNFTFARKL